MHTPNYIHLYFLILLISSCTQFYHPGYTCDNGIIYKIHQIGDGEIYPKQGDRVFVNYQRISEQGALLETRKDTQLLLTDVSDHDIQQCISFLHEGDSATFILKRSGGEAILYMRLCKYLSASEYEDVQKVLAWKHDMEMNEQITLQNYLLSNNISDSSYADGIYFLPAAKGKGRLIEIGNTVVIHYKGSFLDGKVFDSTYDRKQSFEFKIGDDDQVIDGIEKSLFRMRKGAKSKIIVPSQFAFGDSGSSTRIVPPFTTVIYEIEVVKLK